ncbi:MAG: ADP-ribosyltransferase domain-containing protein [Pseudobdellovibrionaceae bacterium]
MKFNLLKWALSLKVAILLLASIAYAQASQNQSFVLNAFEMTFTAALANSPQCKTIVSRSALAAQTLNVLLDVNAETFCVNKSGTSHTWDDGTFQRFVALRARAKYPQWTTSVVSNLVNLPSVIQLSNADMSLSSDMLAGEVCVNILERGKTYGESFGLVMNLATSACTNPNQTEISATVTEQMFVNWVVIGVTGKHMFWIHPLAAQAMHTVYQQNQQAQGNAGRRTLNARSGEARELFQMLDASRTLKGKTPGQYSQLISQTFIEQLVNGRSPRSIGCRDHSVYLPTESHNPLGSDYHLVSLRCLTTEEKYEVRDYRGAGYREMNYQLRRNMLDERMRPKVARLTTAMNKLIPIWQISFRGSGSRQFFTDYQAGQIVADRGFTSSSLDSKVASSFGSAVQIVMMTKTCPYISNVTDHNYGSGENEVLCKPGTLFEVLHREEKNNQIFIVLEEVESHPEDIMNVEF